jgi:hypothetical protein
MINFTYLVCLTLLANASSPSNMEIREDKKYTRLSRVSHLTAPNKIQEWYLGTAVVFRSKLKERRKKGGGGGEIVRESERESQPICYVWKATNFNLCSPFRVVTMFCWVPCNFVDTATTTTQKNCTLHFVRRSNNTINPHWLLLTPYLKENVVKWSCLYFFLPSY